EATPESKRAQVDLIRGLNEAGRPAETNDLRMEGSIRSMELAFRMQRAATDLGDLSRETQATHAHYGVDVDKIDVTARQLLLARRCAEAGIRFVAVGIGGDWDHHGDIANRMPANALSIDKPVAALIEDLKQRGLLDETLVICGCEFGRTPIFQAD